jgi:ribonucrease Y
MSVIVGNILKILISIVIGLFLGAFYRKKIAEALIGSAEIEAVRVKENAIKDSLAKSKEILLSAKEETIRIKSDLEKESKERRIELQRQEKRISQREEALDKKIDSFEKKDEQLQRKIERIDAQKIQLDASLSEKNLELERISGLTAEQAKNYLLSTLESEIKVETAHMIKSIESNAKLEYDKKAKDIIACAIQRCAVDHVAETTVSVVQLPNDEMKGRIIGREGRNIRALESLTGIDFIIDDTPEAVILSGFDAMRREVARIALEKLIIDGRIHPSRIEEMVQKSKQEVEETIRELGESATFELGVHGIHPEIIRLIGKMKFRTSYGQNILKHSIEVAHLCGIMAGELGLDVTLAKRAGLLHDIGKSVDQDLEGSHVQIGAALCRKYKESDVIINTIESHHGDVEPTSIISILATAADSISASRPGARREVLESYIKRLTKLEGIADSFVGVEKSFAIQAGRELRIIIIPEEVDDNGLTIMARNIAKQIESELQYPGQIKINLIRETRAIEYAK